MKPSDQSYLWTHAQYELLSALLLKVTSGDGQLEARILEALDNHLKTLQSAYPKWKRENPNGQVQNFVFSPSAPRFKLPSLKKGKDHKAILSGEQSLLRDELARLTYRDLFALLKKEVKPDRKYNNREVKRKQDVNSCVKEALGVNSVPQWILERWQFKTRREIALEATAWHHQVAPSTLKRKILAEK